MVFSSTVFLLYFLPLFLILYHSVSEKFKNLIILLGSIFFYSWGAPSFVFVILFSTYIDFHIVKKLYRSENLSQRKLFLSASILLNLGLLGYFKYANFFVENLNLALHNLGIQPFAWIEVALPIGISFYTFQTLTYSIDVYRNTEQPLDKVSNYMLYIMSFPQMIAGPIVRFSSIAKQLKNRKESFDDKLSGFYRFCIGLSKKVLIANVLAQEADLIFDSNLNTLSMSQAWIGMTAYTFQIYFDFSGYSDMAIGLGKILGFKFPENFNSPYVAQSISEFWRRWHITLGDFMRDYLYIPLGGNRVSNRWRLFFNLWIVFLLSGLWHGSEWNFVIWGGYHGLFLIFDRIFLVHLLTRLGSIFSTCFTFIIVMFSWIIFRLESLNDIKVYFSKLFSLNIEFVFSNKIEFWSILLIAIAFSFSAKTKLGKHAQSYFFNQKKYSLKEHLFLSSICVLLFAVCLSSITSSEFNPFIYFRF